MPKYIFIYSLSKKKHDELFHRKPLKHHKSNNLLFLPSGGTQYYAFGTWFAQLFDSILQ